MGKLLHHDLTYQLRGLLYATHNALRPGWPEEAYHQALVERIRKLEIPVQSKPKCTLVHQNVPIHTFECDLLVWEKLILELKVLPFSSFAPVHFAQLISYLKSWNKDLGLLVNFGPTRLNIERVAWTNPLFETHRDFSRFVTQSNLIPDSFQEIELIVNTVASQIGLGYLGKIYHKILSVEFSARGDSCLSNVEIPIPLDNRIQPHLAADYLLFENAHLIQVNGLLIAPTSYHFAQMKTFLRALDLQSGIIVNFGKKQLQIFGVPA